MANYPKSNNATAYPSPSFWGLVLFSCFALMMAAWVGCSGPSIPTSDLVVTSFRAVESSKAIRIRFSRPVVEEKLVGAEASPPPLTIEPAVSVTAFWTDRQTLLIKPQEILRPSTRYQVLLSELLPELTGQASFSFVHRPLLIKGLSGVDTQRMSSVPRLVLQFNQPVAAPLVAERCVLRAGVDQSRHIPLSTPDQKLVANTITLEPRAALAQDQDYQLRCTELIGAGGNEPMEKIFTRSLHTYPPFKVTAVAPRGDDIPADEVGITIDFATPVALKALRQALVIHPPARGLRRGWMNGDQTRYKAVLNLKTSTRYTIRVSKGLRDIHGQRLNKHRRFSFLTGNAKPRLVFEKGIYALEAAGAGYPVWTRNLKRFEVECAPVPKRRIVQVLTSDMNYDPWYDGSASAIGWYTLKLRQQLTKVPLPRAKNKWQLHHLDLPRLCRGSTARGLFLAELRSQDLKPDDDNTYRYRPHQRVLANITNLGVLVKAGTASGLVWVTALSNGQPVKGAKIDIFTPHGRKAFSGTSDTQGILRIPGTTRLLRQPGAKDKDTFEEEGYDEYDAYRSQRLIVIVEKDKDLAVVDGNWANGIQIWNFDLPVDRRSGLTRIRGLIQSDRGIYRPGERVHFKGLVREIRMGRSPRVPARAKIAVAVEDSRGATIYQRKRKLSPFGGFSFDLPLEQECALGDYHVTATIKGQTFREKFSVEEFRKVSTELKLRGAKRHVRLGKKQRLSLEARYLFGAPVKGARIEWSVQRRPRLIHFPRHANYSFIDAAARSTGYYWRRRPHRPLAHVSDGEGEADAKGRYSFWFKDPRRSLKGAQDYLVQVTAIDETDQRVSTRMVISAHPSDFYLGLHAQEYVQAVDMPFSINAVALSPDGVQVGAAARLSYVQQRSRCTTAGGHRSYRQCKREFHKVWSREIQIPATGAATERIMPRTPGEFIIRLETKDARGNRVVASRAVWIIGKGEAFWSGDESARMSVVASKSSYTPGETARLVPRASMSGATALITLERNGILEARVQQLTTSGEGIEVPIKDQHAPNIFASVVLVRGRTGSGDRHRPLFKMGMVDLQVSPNKQRLRVAIETTRESYQPGERVQGKVRVLAADGSPARAEIALSAADEGVLQLIAYQTPDPIKTFYASWGLGIDSSTNWNRIARLNDPNEIDPEEGGDSGPGAGHRVRSNFVSSAFWAPALITDARGEVSFSFTAPDNLTAFRLMAVAADKGARFGSGERRFTVSKPLLAKPVLPRFLTAGDRATVGVVVHNYTGAAGTARVTARVRGAHLRVTKRKIKIAKGGARRVNFPLRARFVKQATFRFAVEMGGSKDALELTLPVRRSLILEQKIIARGVVEGTVTASIHWPKAILPRDSHLEISVDRLGLSELKDSLRYLIEYPYGCLEQTLSGFIPLTKVKDLAASLKLPQLRGARLRTFIRGGVAKVIRHQQESGQFSLWPGGTTYPHLTAYAMFGLNEARRAKIKVDPAALKRGRRALAAWANGAARTMEPGGELATMAMAAFVLADLGAPDPGLNARLYEARRGLPHYGRAFLLRAMKRAGSPQAQLKVLTEELLAGIVDQGDQAMIRERNPRLSRYMSSDVRTSAITLSALLQLHPEHPLVAKLVEGLKRSRRANGRWTSTQDNIYSLVALADYARTQAAGITRVTLQLNGRTLVRRVLRGNKILTYKRSLHRLKQGKLSITTKGLGRYTVRLVTARRTAGLQAIDRGFAISREYLDPSTDQAVSQATIGQVIKVRLKVTPSSYRHYVALADPLPAGFEAVNAKLATTQSVGGATPPASSSWYGRSLWTHRSLRDDRLWAFADYMSGGTHTLEYLVRATIEGTFTADPAQVEAMYEPDLFGRTTAATIKVVK